MIIWRDGSWWIEGIRQILIRQLVTFYISSLLDLQ